MYKELGGYHLLFFDFSNVLLSTSNYQCIINKEKIMPSNSELTLLAKCLDLDDVKVVKFGFVHEFGLVISIENEYQEAECPKCKKKTNKVNRNDSQIIRDLPMMGKSVYLKINRRQMRCQKCGHKFVEELNYVKRNRKFTNRMIEKIIKEVINSDIRNTAINNEVSEQEIQTMLKQKGEELKKEKPVGLKKLGIDEIALVKGKKNYCAVLVNIETREILGILEKRSKEELMKYLKEWGKQVLLGIEEVSIDMWKPYKTVAEEIMPQAEIVVDRFHLMKLINEEVDKARKRVKREMEVAFKKAKGKKRKQEFKNKLEAIKKSKYVLLKNQEHLEEQEEEKLKIVLQEYPELRRVYRLKEKLRQIFNTCDNWGDGLLRITNWLRRATSYLPESCGTIIRWLGEIIAYFDNRTTQGVVEGINNKLKLIKRRSYGFRNFNNFVLRCDLSFSLAS